jgi:hypothetical protein
MNTVEKSVEQVKRAAAEAIIGGHLPNASFVCIITFSPQGIPILAHADVL